MALSPSLPFPPEERVLAAVVFTDVAGFSARMQKEETITLQHLERDFITMREFSAMHSGTVIKSTGDGLMLYFTSAVHAVEWSLRTQRHFAEQARTYPPAEILRHRVGVHVGEVFVRADDVMGDGVNIAARVQTEAPAGGICISQTVYDVVKNKMKLHVIRLEPRKLKNISENIQMYHVLLDAPPAVPPVVIAPKKSPSAPREESSAKPQKLVVIGLLVVAVAVVAALMVQAYFEHEKELARSQAAQAALGAALRSEKVEPATTPPEQERVLAGKVAEEEFDFAKMTAARPASDPVPATEQRARQVANEYLLRLDAWMSTGLQHFTKDRPLVVPQLRTTSFQNMTVFTDANRQLYFAEGGAIRRQQWKDLRPEIQGAIVVSALRYSPTPPPRDVIRGAEAFAYVHGLGEMAATLIRERAAPGGRAP